jgi:hypothetical protein
MGGRRVTGNRVTRREKGRERIGYGGMGKGTRVTGKGKVGTGKELVAGRFTGEKGEGRLRGESGMSGCGGSRD